MNFDFKPASNLPNSYALEVALELRVTRATNWRPAPSTLQLWRIQERIDEHIRNSRDNHFRALCRANIRLLFGYGLEEK